MGYPMIRHGIKLAILCFFGFSVISLYSMESTKSEKAVFKQISSVSVLPVICGTQIDKNKVKVAIEKALSSFGTVSPDNPQNFGKGNSVLNIMIGPIAEQNSQPGMPAKYLPVVSVSMQLLTGAEMISDKQASIFGLAWEKQGFIDTNQKDFDVVLSKTIQSLLANLQEKYKETKTKPNFSIQQL